MTNSYLRIAITTHLKQNYNQEVALLDSTFHTQKIAPLERESSELQQRNFELNKGVREKREAYNIEVTKGANGRPDGEGPYAAFKLNEFQRDSTRAEQRTAANNQRINGIEVRLDSLNADLAHQKKQIPTPEEAGLLDFTEALFHQVWVDGDLFTQGLFSLLFLLGLFIESLTLLAKLGFAASFKAYHRQVDRKRDLLSKKHKRECKTEDKLDELKQNKALQEKVSAIEREIQINSINNTHQLSVERLNARLEAVRDKANLIFEAIRETDDMDKKIREILDDDVQYQEYGTPLVTEYSLNKIKEISDDVHGENA